MRLVLEIFSFTAAAITIVRGVKLSELLNRWTALLFLNNGVLDHADTIARGELAFHRDRLGRVVRKLRICWLVIANEQVGLAIARFNTNR